MVDETSAALNWNACSCNNIPITTSVASASRKQGPPLCGPLRYQNQCFRDLTHFRGICHTGVPQVRYMRNWDPLGGHLKETDVDLTWSTLPYVDGAYVPDRQLVILHPGTTVVNQRSALAEELAHHELDHWPVEGLIELARMDLRARRWGAIRLIDVEQILEAVRWTPYLHEVAELLDVDPDLLAIRVELMSDEERTLLNERLRGMEAGE